MILKQILLDCFQRIDGQRSASSIFHLIKGKRSIQTIQDAHLFRLQAYYGIYKNITRNDFEKELKMLLHEEFLSVLDEGDARFLLTDKGKGWLTYQQDMLYFNGIAYFERAEILTERLLLLVQTLTNSARNHYSFFPVIDNSAVENWVKQVYRKVKGSESVLLKSLHNELGSILTQFTDREAMIFVERLSGYKTYGLSLFQMEQRYGLHKDDAQLILCSISHRMLHSIESNPATYPTLAKFSGPPRELTPLTQSARQTYHFLLKNYSIEQIAATRNLKENTIFDHIVEIAFYVEDFPIDQYVSSGEQAEIIDAIQRVKTNRLKDIKALVSEQISYFQIRLVMAIENKRKQG